MTIRRSARLFIITAVLPLGLALSGCEDSETEACLGHMHDEAVREGIQMDHDEYANNRCGVVEGEADPNWRDHT
ncbi:hypothetical protein [Nocardioides secundeburneus]|uniref:hypothetical protein n=1 Tax=Nocardioides sp. C4-1 TaxID=3151851 RepID=UPI003266ABDE